MSPKQIQQPPPPIINIPDFLGGLFLEADGARIPQNALTVADHIEYFRGMPFRRNGVNPWPVAKPDSNAVQGIFVFTETVTGLNVLRFSKSKIHKSTSSAWVEFTPSGISAMGGGSSDYFSYAVIDNRMFFSNNGVDPIREIDPVGQVYKALGNAPQFKYICGAFNRVIGVNNVDVIDTPNQVGWCGESNYGEWNPLVDISAGRQNLVSSTTNDADDITGIFSVGELLLVPRRNSFWLGQHTPSSTSPFSFFSAPGLARIGADLPRTIKLTDYGLVWLSNNTSTVYVYEPSTYQPTVEQVEITQKIRRALRVALNNSSQVWASYGHETRIYTIFISYVGTSSVATFSYNFISKTWTTSSYLFNPSEVIDSDYGNAAITINDLAGTINTLQGTIDSLGGLSQNATRIFGYANGEISTQQPYSGLPSEINNIAISDTVGSSTSHINGSIGLKILEMAPFNINNILVRFGLYVYSAGTMILLYSKDDGATFNIAKTIVYAAGSPTQTTIQIKRSGKVRRVIWRLATTDSCMFSVTDFTITPIEAGVA